MVPIFNLTTLRTCSYFVTLIYLLNPFFIMVCSWTHFIMLGVQFAKTSLVSTSITHHFYPCLCCAYCSHLTSLSFPFITSETYFSKVSLPHSSAVFPLTMHYHFYFLLHILFFLLLLSDYILTPLLNLCLLFHNHWHSLFYVNILKFYFLFYF